MFGSYLVFKPLPVSFYRIRFEGLGRSFYNAQWYHSAMYRNTKETSLCPHDLHCGQMLSLWVPGFFIGICSWLINVCFAISIFVLVLICKRYFCFLLWRRGRKMKGIGVIHAVLFQLEQIKLNTNSRKRVYDPLNVFLDSGFLLCIRPIIERYFHFDCKNVLV